jgi:hypothetical protein
MADKRKAPKARVVADRAEMMRKSTTRAGKAKSDRAVRQVQNKGVKDGTIRVGKAGKSYNVYDAKSGTWKRGVVKYTGQAAASKPAATPRGGTRKEAGIVRRPTNMNPTYGAEYVPGRGRYMVDPSRKRK